MSLTRQEFLRRAETFGFDTEDPWALETLRLLFCVPRAYKPLVDAWVEHYPGVRKALRRLEVDGWVGYQPGLILDTRTGVTAQKCGRPVTRYRTTKKGCRLLERSEEDLRWVEAKFPRTSSANLDCVLDLLNACDLEGSHARYGLSGAHGGQLAGFGERTGRWWVRRLVSDGYLREMPFTLSDVREVIPAHWRVTRELTRQVARVLDAFDQPATLKTEFRLGRDRFLGDIDPARLGISGATDFDHDVQAQRILASLLGSPRCVADAQLTVEPRHVLPLRHGYVGVYDLEGDGQVFYLPDAETREVHDQTAWRCVVEYERYQSRRDGWDHIERFCGYLHTKVQPFESAVLRFVVDSPQRRRSYVSLIEAFADYLVDRPAQRPVQDVRLAVSSVDAVLNADDPLDWAHWNWVSLLRAPEATAVEPWHHGDSAGPYDDYFVGVS